MLRLDERSVRERLINGQLKGEKKQIGLREKWFVYSGAVEAALAKQGAFNTDSREFTDVTVEGENVAHSSSEHGGHAADATIDDVGLDVSRDKLKILAEEIVKPLMEKIEVQQELIFEQKQTIADQDRQLRLLPDLQKQAEQREQEAGLKHVENEALKKQIEAMAEEKKTAEAVISQMMDDIEKLKTPWWRRMFSAQKEA